MRKFKMLCSLTVLITVYSIFVTSVCAEEVVNTVSEAEASDIIYDDPLQQLFASIDLTLTEEKLNELIQSFGLLFSSEEWNGSPKNITYKIAAEEEVTLQKYAKEGNHVEVSFDKDSGLLLYAVYENAADLMEGVLYNYGTYWDFREKEPNNTYSGYYYHRAGDMSKDGIEIIYSNGNKAETSYHPCDNAYEVLENVK